MDLFAQVGCEGVEHGEELDELLLSYDGAWLMALVKIIS